MGLLNRVFKSKVAKLEASGDVAALRAVMANDRSSEQRVAAVEALARIAGESVPAIMVEALGNGHVAVVAVAEELLRGIGEPAATALAEALGGASGERALELLLSVGEDAADALLQATGATDELARERALRGLLAVEREHADEDLHDPVFSCLLATLGDRSPALRAMAAGTLAARSDPRAARALAAQLKDGDERVRNACRDALGRIGEAAIPELIFTIGDRNANARRLAAELLAELCSATTDRSLRRQALAATLRIAADRDEGVRAAAQKALEDIPAADVVAAELALLADPESSDHDEVVDFLGRLLVSPAVSAADRHAAVERMRALGFAVEE